MSRPTKLNYKMQEQIVQAIRAGNYIETAASYAGINKTTLYDWLRRGAREKERVANNNRARIRKEEQPYVEFSNAVEKALAEAEMRDVLTISKAAEEQWQAAAWRLERKFPDRWGRRMLDIKASHVVESKDDARLRTIIAENPELFDGLFDREE